MTLSRHITNLFRAAPLLLAVVTSFVRAEVVQGPIYNPETGHFYFLLSQKNWTASEAEAQLLGGHLATINDAEEQNWIYQTFGVGFNAGRLLWIGLNDAADEGVYRWSSGEEVTFSAWAPGEPNATQTGEDFVALYYLGHNAQSLWNDWSNISADPIGIPLMGVAEVAPRDWQPSLRSVTYLDFEDASTMHFMPAPVPPSAYLTDNYLSSHGVRFYSGSEPAVAVQLGEGHATSGLNGFAGIRNGQLDYSAPVTISFWTPTQPELAATADFISLRLDQFGGGNGPVHLSGYNLRGDMIASTSVGDVGGAVLSLAIPGLHRVVFEGNGNVALDDLLIGNLTPSRPILRIQREGNFVRAAWPIAFLGWTLEFTHDLRPPIAWIHGSNLIESNGDELSVRMPVANSQSVFFRLSQPQQP